MQVRKIDWQGLLHMKYEVETICKSPNVLLIFSKSKSIKIFKKDF